MLLNKSHLNYINSYFKISKFFSFDRILIKENLEILYCTLIFEKKQKTTSYNPLILLHLYKTNKQKIKIFKQLNFTTIVI